MKRFKLTLEYDGTDFVGWQRQLNGLSVQQVIEEAAFAYCQTKIVVHGAGRTDAGVHALAQVAHIDSPRDDDGRKVRDALNALMRPHPIAVITAEHVADDSERQNAKPRRRLRLFMLSMSCGLVTL
jgi:tRNA pseudouridine38-40 synthase